MSIGILYALGATLLFSLASIAYTSFSRSISVAWVNYFKASVACVGFLVLALVTKQFQLPSWESVGLLGLSGIVGLCIGDMFLFRSFTNLGPGRTLILFSFHPIFTGVGSYFLFGQGLTLYQMLAIFFMVACLIVLGRENMDKDKKWRVLPLLTALFAISLDAMGVLLTRQAFEYSPGMDSSMANWIRGLFCVGAFTIWTLKRPIGLYTHFDALKIEQKLLIFLTACFGTFVSLYLYLNALKYGHLATISAISATGPLWATLFEYVFFKSKPSKSLVYTFGLFAVGMILLNF